MSRSLVIVSTGPASGAHTIATMLAAAISRRGIKINIFHPVEVGCPETSPAEKKLLSRQTPKLLSAAGLNRDSDLQVGFTLADCNPYQFAAPFAPAICARLVDKQIDLERLEQSFHRLSASAQLTLTVLTGDLGAPLTTTALNVDFLVRLQRPIILVCRSSPDSLGQTLLAMEILKNRQLTLAGVILKRWHKEISPAEAATTQQIENFAGKIVRGVVPYYSDEELANYDFLGRRAEIHIDIDALLAPLFEQLDI